MIVTKTMIVQGKEFVRTYSDSGYMIKQTDTGEVYGEAIDPAEMGRTYTETDELIVPNETEAKARAYDILMGGE